MRFLMIAAVAVAGCLVSQPSVAFENALGLHLEHQRWQRLQDHQNRQRQQPAQRPEAEPQQRQRVQQQALPRCTEDHVPRREYAKLEGIYGDILRQHGKRTADDWSRRQADAWYQALKRQGVCR
ncbi:hypothetical protein [uncultured Paracoccus sp.]|uniref:hypothetical protein n=1 Tax=uncultured Paracoccus sp. TaxID=189685 RepID=UPI0025F48BC0|nr:hypothetical protein [uncultured Paracoccus sp.]